VQFIWGALVMANATAALFFLRFFRDTGDRLFAFFGGGFCALALNYAVLALVQPSREERHFVYLIRLAAFGLILFGVIEKNRRK
jgi:hypothetical protein